MQMPKYPSRLMARRRSLTHAVQSQQLPDDLNTVAEVIAVLCAGYVSNKFASDPVQWPGANGHAFCAEHISDKTVSFCAAAAKAQAGKHLCGWRLSLILMTLQARLFWRQAAK